MGLQERYYNWECIVNSSDGRVQSEFYKNFQFKNPSPGQTEELRLRKLKLKDEDLDVMKKSKGFQQMVIRMGLYNLISRPCETDVNFAPFIQFYEKEADEPKEMDFAAISPYDSRDPCKYVMPERSSSKGLFMGDSVTPEFVHTLSCDWVRRPNNILVNSFYDPVIHHTRTLRLYNISALQNPVLYAGFEFLIPTSGEKPIDSLEALTLHLGFKEKTGFCRAIFPFNFSLILDFKFNDDQVAKDFNKVLEQASSNHRLPEDCNPARAKTDSIMKNVYFQYIRPCPPFCNSL